MVNIVLVEPEIPQNTGNIVRSCAATGAKLHLVRPLGFSVDDKYLKRAGLDYWADVDIQYYDSFDQVVSNNKDAEFWLCTTKANQSYHKADLKDGCFLVFGKETKGLEQSLIDKYQDKCIHIPMRGAARSLNLANSVAIILYEALRQQDFKGLECASIKQKTWKKTDDNHKKMTKTLKLPYLNLSKKFDIISGGVYNGYVPIAEIGKPSYIL